jgi:hypothetical protein
MFSLSQHFPGLTATFTLCTAPPKQAPVQQQPHGAGSCSHPGPVRINDRAQLRAAHHQTALHMPGRAACACRSICQASTPSIPTDHTSNSSTTHDWRRRQAADSTCCDNHCMPDCACGNRHAIGNIPANSHEQSRSSCCTQSSWALLHITEPR